jgi:DeoR/GlpR family transcriptional regulator of sugar metabolism
LTLGDGSVILPIVLASQRREVILDLVRDHGTVRVRDLARTLDVSEMTVRRDLDALAGDGLVAKVHGGATQVTGRSSVEPGFEAKQRLQAAEKKAIASLAASLVTPGASIGLTAGTTTWTLVTELVQVPALTIVTNAPSVAQVCYHGGRQDQTVLLTGGIRTPSDALVGPIATATLSSLHLDMVFMGVHGMDERLGFSTPNLAEAEVNRAFVASTDELIVVADHTKWETSGLVSMAALGAASIVVSDDRLADRARTVLTEHGVEVMLAPVGGGTRAAVEAAVG